jgi:hypothetical protein
MINGTGSVEGHAQITDRNGPNSHIGMQDRAVVKSGNAVFTTWPRCGEPVSSPALCLKKFGLGN